jgi:hypothetical protein
VTCLCALIAIVLPGSKAAAIERHALLIGISNYQYVRSLEGPRYDARALRTALIEEWGFDPVHIEMLLDGDATRNRIETALTGLMTRTQPGDYVVLFYSGHGTSRLDVRSPWPLPDGTGALIPADFRAEGTVEAQTARLIVGRRDLRPVLEELDRNGRRVFVIIDSCYSGNAVRSQAPFEGMPLRYIPLADPAPTREIPASATLDSLRDAPPAAYPYRNVTFLAASGEHEAATDIGRDLIARFPTSDDLPHGALTDAVLRILTGRVQADGNADGEITYDELYRGVRTFMDERGYPQSPRLLPDGDDREAIVARPVFELVQTPAATKWQAAGEIPIRVQLANDLEALRPPLSAIDGVEIAADAPDILIQRDEMGIVLTEQDGDVIDRLDGVSTDAIAERLRREIWARRLLESPAANGNFKLTVELSAPEHRTVVAEGEAFAFSVATGKPAYIMMLSIDPAGTVSVLYPSDTDATPAVLTPDAPLLVSSPQLRVQVPFGTEHIVVAATESRPVGLMRLAGRRVGPDSSLRPDLERIIEEAEREGAKASLRFKTVESSVSSP